MEAILFKAAKILFFLFSLILYVAVVGIVFPKVFLEKFERNSALMERGIKKYIFAQGRAIVYEPAVKMRKYVEQYILSAYENRKTLKCKINEKIQNINYDVAVFDCNDKLIGLFTFFDPISEKGYTHDELLPAETSYISLVVRSVNGKEISNEAIVFRKRKAKKKFSICVIVATVLESLFMKSALLDISHLLFSSSGIVFNFGFLITSLLGIAVGLVLSMIILNLYKSKSVGDP
jgi:hypothetical protein